MEQLLKKYFGYDEFRPMQLEIIKTVLAKKDCLVLMPTGGGKSLCYQIPALKFEGLTIVISPLISLMKDQVDALKANGVSAEYINSTLTPKKIEDIKRRIKNKGIKILYIAPERLSSIDFKPFLLGLQISLIAIDEAHCISEWGHDFRKDYRNLKFLKKIFVGVPIIALTATATLKVKDDILKQLNLDKPKVFVSSFDRDNLNLLVMRKKDSLGKILNLIHEHKNESVIIYCFSRKDTEGIAKQLNQCGLKALPYHAGLSNKIRKRNQELFTKDKVNIMVATIAFGMGIDKPDVRLVIHHTFSKSVESYYQEIGRAGRDGLRSDCVLFYSRGDMRKHEYFINMIKDFDLKKGMQDKLNEMQFYCESSYCRRKYLLKYFGEKYEKDNCKSCDVCLNLPEMRTIPIYKNTNYDIYLFEELKALRAKIAEERGVSPFIVFGNVALIEMASTFPTTDEQFLKISGVGQQKLSDFGEDFLILINEYVVVNNIANKFNEVVSGNILASRDDGTKPRKVRKLKKIKSTKPQLAITKKLTTKSKTKKSTRNNLNKVWIKNNDLFEALRVLRKKIANKKKIPAFVVFSDMSLREMAYKLPRDDKDFLNIKGVGLKKLQNFGKEFLFVINSYACKK